MKKAVISITMLCLALCLWPQSALTDPQIPDGETIRYRVTQGDIEEYVYHIVTHDVFDGKNCYLLEEQSLDEISKSYLTRDPFLSLYLEQKKLSGRAPSTTTRRLDSTPRMGENELAMLDMADMAFLLRGYPFDKPRTLNVLLLDSDQEESETMSFKIQPRGNEKISLNGRSFDAHKLELKIEMKGAMALFSGMIPKTYLWYDRGNGHRLLKYTGSAGPGTDEILMEMVDYSP